MFHIFKRKRLLFLFYGFSMFVLFAIVIWHQNIFMFPSRRWRNSFLKSVRNCNASKHVLFLKTHKTASSTITNILNRFADSNNLTIALPLPGWNRFHWPETFKASYINVKKLRHDKPDILCNHARYNWGAMSAVMPKDTAYITILRHPEPLFVSAFSYFELPKSMGIPGKSLHEQMRNFLKNSHGFMKKAGSSEQLIQNGMLFDLGLDRVHFENKGKIRQRIKHLEDKFSLVLIMEHFEESLVLLKRQLCWGMEDVTYFKMLQRQTKRQQLPADVKRLISNFSQADVMLYNHFNKTLWEKTKRQDVGFYEEVEQLKALNGRLFEQCGGSRETTHGLGTNVKVWAVRMKANNISEIEKKKCCRMTRNEVHYLSYHNTKQDPSNNAWMREPRNVRC